MRFICEWCLQQVSIVNKQKVYDEVLTHFTACSHRSAMTTDEQVIGLAEHITGIIADREEKRMRNVG